MKTFAICVSCIAGPILAILMFQAHADSNARDHQRAVELGRTIMSMSQNIEALRSINSHYPDAQAENNVLEFQQNVRDFQSELSRICVAHTWNVTEFLHP